MPKFTCPDCNQGIRLNQKECSNCGVELVWKNKKEGIEKEEGHSYNFPIDIKGFDRTSQFERITMKQKQINNYYDIIEAKGETYKKFYDKYKDTLQVNKYTHKNELKKYTKKEEEKIINTFKEMSIDFQEEWKEYKEREIDLEYNKKILEEYDNHYPRNAFAIYFIAIGFGASLIIVILSLLIEGGLDGLGVKSIVFSYTSAIFGAYLYDKRQKNNRFTKKNNELQLNMEKKLSDSEETFLNIKQKILQVKNINGINDAYQNQETRLLDDKGNITKANKHNDFDDTYYGDGY